MNFLVLQNGKVLERVSDASEAQNRALELAAENPRATYETARILRKIYTETTPGTSSIKRCPSAKRQTSTP